jgi:acyl dehydratase
VRVEVGDLIPSWTMERVTPERMRTVAAIYRDPNPVHYDASEVARRGLGERTINQSPLNLAYIANMLMAWGGPTCIRRLRVTFPGVVLDGDRVTAHGRVRELRIDGEVRLAECEIWLEKADGGRAVEGSALVALPHAMEAH